MSCPTPQSVARLRYVIVVVCRAAGVVGLAVAAFLLLRNLWQAPYLIREFEHSTAGGVLQQFLEFAGPIAAFGVLGWASLRYSSLIARIIAPDPTHACGRCGYLRAGLAPDAPCPECGTATAPTSPVR